MAPPPLPLFSPYPKPSPPPPWLHGPATQNHDPHPTEVAPPKPSRQNPKQAPSRNAGPPAKTKPLTTGVPGGRTRRAVLGIIRRVRSLERSDPPTPVYKRSSDTPIAFLDLPIELPPAPREKEQEHREDEEGPKPRAVPWAAARNEDIKAFLQREKKPREPTRAEREMAADELERLRRASRGMDRWVRAKKAGVTEEVVEEVRGEWNRGQELAAVRLVDPLRRCMDRAREILEIKTGGIVVWTKGDIHFVYRGSDYLQNTKHHRSLVTDVQKVSQVNHEVPTSQGNYISTAERLVNEKYKANDYFPESEQSSVHMHDGPVKGTLYEREVNRLLDGLGPRFVDWWWNTPLPVDADLLPEYILGFKTLFRQCPPGVRPTLADDELTYLRKLARHLPTHFALGRNTKLQGLASAILKLWEKSLIAKIAVKVGVQNTNHQEMARNLKRLTGGTIILRNKDFIILYRGKDFLPGGVAQSVIQREAQVHEKQVKEEEARLKAVDSLQMVDAFSSAESSIGTFREYQDVHANLVHEKAENNETMVELEAEKYRLEKELKDHEWKLFALTKKIERSNQALAKLRSFWSTSGQSADRELLTEEEKMVFRKLGLKMDEHVLLGRRGVFAGVIEEIHQHWKHKEVVKVITKQNRARQIMYTAKLLEIETGGILIAVEKRPTSHAIILYRGKNYRRPKESSPANLLTKREALHRSVEAQRRGSLKYFARQRQKSILEVKRRLIYVTRKIRYLTPRP